MEIVWALECAFLQGGGGGFEMLGEVPGLVGGPGGGDHRSLGVGFSAGGVGVWGKVTNDRGGRGGGEAFFGSANLRYV